MASTRPGRSCPRHYRYSPAVFSRAADLKAQSLYIVGGLYGNPFALEAVLAMARREGATLVFNGDFNWFNVDPAEFEGVNKTVLRHAALRGNVETEIAGEDSGAGCGCAYPEWVGEAEVERSNEILRRLRGTAGAYPELRERLAVLPMHLVAEVAGLRIGIVHGTPNRSPAGSSRRRRCASVPNARGRCSPDPASTSSPAPIPACR